MGGMDSSKLAGMGGDGGMGGFDDSDDEQEVSKPGELDDGKSEADPRRKRKSYVHQAHDFQWVYITDPCFMVEVIRFLQLVAGSPVWLCWRYVCCLISVVRCWVFEFRAGTAALLEIFRGYSSSGANME